MVSATSLFSEATLRFVLLGTATGSLTALVALGIVIVHRASGVLNFSAGAFGGIAAYYCYDIRDDVPTALAVAGGLALGVLLGVLTHLVLSLLRDASQLAKLIATLGLFSAGQAFMILRWGVGVVQPDPLLPSRNVTLWGDLRIGQDRLVLIGIALACAGILRVVYTGTLFGLATSAVAENRRVAASSGWSPTRLELANFAIAGGLSALAAILLAPIVTLNAAVLSVAVLPALAAALVGRFSSFGITVGAALLIGIGSAMDGMIVVSPTVPPNAVDNPGIAEFREDLEAIGRDPDAPTIDFTAVTAWSNIKKLEEALLAAGGPDFVADLTSEALVQALLDHPVARPEAAPYDFRENQLTELPGLAAFRVFTRSVALLELQGGEYRLLAEGFVDILDPPDLG